MTRIASLLTLTAGLIALAPPPVRAQGHDPEGGHMMPHARPFSQGPRAGWTTSAPHLDINGGLYAPDAGSSLTRGFFRLHAQLGLGPRLLELASDVLWVPERGATPTVAGVLQLAPVAEGSPFYVSGGIGVVTGRSGARDRLRGWVQGIATWRSPVHEISPFVQVGRALGDAQRTELLFGIAHPLAP